MTPARLPSRPLPRQDVTNILLAVYRQGIENFAKEAGIDGAMVARVFLQSVPFGVRRKLDISKAVDALQGSPRATRARERRTK